MGYIERSPEVESLLHLLWECDAAADDGIPVPFERWIMDDGPATTPGRIKELRDGYDTMCEMYDEATS